MALKKCKKCKKEISDTTKFCPHCGEASKTQFCRECGKEMSLNETSCPNCGYMVNAQAFYRQPLPQAPIIDPNKGEKYELAIVSLVMSFVVPIAGLIMGIMCMKANTNKKSSAYTMGKIATIVSAIYMILVVLLVILYFVLLIAIFATEGYY